MAKQRDRGDKGKRGKKLSARKRPVKDMDVNKGKGPKGGLLSAPSSSSVAVKVEGTKSTRALNF